MPHCENRRGCDLRFQPWGRQLNAAPAVISSLPQIRNAVGHDMVLTFDGGVRRGEDFIKPVPPGPILSWLADRFSMD